MANNVGQGSYAIYPEFDNFSYTCITYLMNNDEMVWKLLKYKSPDAWDKPNLTYTEKAELIYKGSDDTTRYNVFMDIGSPDVITREDCIIRIAPYSIFPDNRVIGTVSMMFEVYCNYHINTLNNYKTRVDMITQRFLTIFNGADIKGIGKLFFDRLGSESNRLEWGSQIPHKGRWIIMSTKSH